MIISSSVFVAGITYLLSIYILLFLSMSLFIGLYWVLRALYRVLKHLHLFYK